jgi:hypothetical protein
VNHHLKIKNFSSIPILISGAWVLENGFSIGTRGVGFDI